MPETIQLTDIIAPAFYPVHWDVIDGKHTYYDLSGGRGFTKSSFISVEIVLEMMMDRKYWRAYKRRRIPKGRKYLFANPYLSR